MLPDEAAFLKAIGDNPADETARLAFADWLADRDDPRSAFARLSADFLRCVRGLADMRRAMSTEWLEVMDPLFNRFCIYSLPALGQGVSQATVRDIFVTPGGSIAKGQAIFTMTTEPRMHRQLGAEESGLVTSVFVRPGETVAITQPLFAYLAGLEKFALRTPRAPMLAFIHSLESQRRTLRQNPRELNEAMLARHATALEIIFGTEAVRAAREVAQRELGWSTYAVKLETLLEQRGVTAEEWVQVRIDIHIQTLQRLLAKYGQPDGFRELPEPSDGTAPASE